MVITGPKRENVGPSIVFCVTSVLTPFPPDGATPLTSTPDCQTLAPPGVDRT